AGVGDPVALVAGGGVVGPQEDEAAPEAARVAVESVGQVEKREPLEPAPVQGAVDPDLALDQGEAGFEETGGTGGEGRAHLAGGVAEKGPGPPHDPIPVLLHVDEPEELPSPFRPQGRDGEAADRLGPDHRLAGWRG